MIPTKMYSDDTFWDNVYSRNLQELPWLSNDIPKNIFTRFKDKMKDNSKILDYGCGNGCLSKLFAEKYQLFCADISEKALFLCQQDGITATFIQAETPKIFLDSSFEGILCWGVLHHILPEARRDFLIDFQRILTPDGFMLIGGWSCNDIEFEGLSERISSITHSHTWAVDINVGIIAKEIGLKIIETNTFNFIESVRNKERTFVYYLLQK